MDVADSGHCLDSHLAGRQGPVLVEIAFCPYFTWNESSKKETESKRASQAMAVRARFEIGLLTVWSGARRPAVAAGLALAATRVSIQPKTSAVNAYHARLSRVCARLSRV